MQSFIEKVGKNFSYWFQKKAFPEYFFIRILIFELIWDEISGALLPSHGLPPFGANITNIAMSEGLCGSSMFGGDRWGVGVNPMTAGKWFERVGHH